MVAAEPRKRLTADERRVDILDAARVEFASRGLHGTSTEDIARRAGISQPYVFRLFGTKKELFVAACRSCMEETLGAMRDAAAGTRGDEALAAMGTAYLALLAADPRRLMLQLHMYAACDDEDVRAEARRGYGALVEFVEDASGAGQAAVSAFFAKGMLINVVAAMGLREDASGWGRRLLEGCREDA